VGVSGTGTVPSVVLYEQGDVVFVAINSGNLTAVGYVFKGWGSTSNATVPTYVVSGSTVNPPSFSMSASNITLYAVWQSIGGGEGFDGGTINSPLEIMCKFPSFANHDAVRNWMDSSSPPNPQDYTAYLRFTNKNPSPTLSTDIYGVTFKEGNNYVAGVGINDSLLVRKNLYAKKGGIDLLSVPIGLKVDWIENFTNDNDLTLKATVGQKIKLDGNVQITGTLTGGGQSGGGSSGSNIFSDKIFVKTTPPVLNPIVIIRKVWGFENGVWNVAGFTATGDRGTSWVSFTDDNPPTSVPGVNLFMIRVEEAAPGDGHDPILAVDRGMLVQKDFTAGGFLAANQGALYLGSGLNYQTDIPKIILRNAYIPLLGSDGTALMGAPKIPSGTSFPSNKKKFQMFIRINSYNGNPPNTLYKYNPAPDKWEPMGPTSNFAGTFDTLYIRQMLFNGIWSDDTPGHLDVGNVTIHGTQSNLKSGHAGTSGGGNNDDEPLGQRTIHFRDINGELAPFSKVPVVTVTILDPNNSSDLPMIAKITYCDLDRFTVRTYRMVATHKHRIGSITGEMGKPDPNVLQMRAVGMNDSTGNNHTLGSVLVPSWPSNNTQKDLFTDEFNPSTSAALYEPFFTEFYWTACEKTQPDPKPHHSG